MAPCTNRIPVSVLAVLAQVAHYLRCVFRLREIGLLLMPADLTGPDNITGQPTRKWMSRMVLVPKRFLISQNVDLRNLFEFVVQGWLKHAHIENSVTQREGCRMRGDKLTNDLGPRVDYFSFMQALAKSRTLHQLRHQLRGRLPAVDLRFLPFV